MMPRKVRQIALALAARVCNGRILCFSPVTEATSDSPTISGITTLKTESVYSR